MAGKKVRDIPIGGRFRLRDSRLNQTSIFVRQEVGIHIEGSSSEWSFVPYTERRKLSDGKEYALLDYPVIPEKIKSLERAPSGQWRLAVVSLF